MPVKKKTKKSKPKTILKPAPSLAKPFKEYTPKFTDRIAVEEKVKSLIDSYIESQNLTINSCQELSKYLLVGLEEFYGNIPIPENIWRRMIVQVFMKENVDNQQVILGFQYLWDVDSDTYLTVHKTIHELDMTVIIAMFTDKKSKIVKIDPEPKLETKKKRPKTAAGVKGKKKKK